MTFDARAVNTRPTFFAIHYGWYGVTIPAPGETGAGTAGSHHAEDNLVELIAPMFRDSAGAHPSRWLRQTA